MQNSIELVRTKGPPAAPLPSQMRDDAMVTLPSLTVSLLFATAINLLSLWPLQTALRQVLEPNMVTSSVLLLLWLSAIFTPLVSLTKGLIFALLAWSLLILLDAPVRIRSLLAILVRGEVILAGTALLTAATLLIRGVGSIQTQADLRVPLGVDLFVEPSSPVWLAVTSHLTIVHVVWFAFVVLSVAPLRGVGRARAVAAASGIWVTSITFAVLRTMMTS